MFLKIPLIWLEVVNFFLICDRFWEMKGKIAIAGETMDYVAMANLQRLV